MSINNSVSEQPEDVADLPDLYNKELMRETNFSYTNCSNNLVVSEGMGGYQEWRAKNGFDISDKMVSSLGRALHSQGIIAQSDSDIHRRDRFHNQPSTSVTRGGGDHRRQNRVNLRFNASDPGFPHQYSKRSQDSSEIVYTDLNYPDPRDSANERQFHYSYAEKAESDCYDNGFVNNVQCCPNQELKTTMISPKNQSSLSNHTEHVNFNRNRNHTVSHPECNHSNPDSYHQDQNINVTPNQIYYRVPNQCRVPLNQSCNKNCHPQAPLPCCTRNYEMPSRPVSPQKKSNSNKKTEASIKKLYRILWLQNEQLGLLEKQVSKLIEINFSKESTEKTNENICNKSNEVLNATKKPETCDVGIMTDLPCQQCCLNNKNTSSSESDTDAIKRPSVEDSLTLHGVDIPVSADDLASPPVSMHIEMQEYQESSSSEEVESDTSEDDSEPVGWTFYDNVVGQVNNLLKAANKKKSKKKKAIPDESNIITERLKHIGITGPEYDSNNPKRVTFEEGLKEQQINLRAQSEISMNFNALASKYLSSSGGKVQDISMCNIVSSNTNMSLATMRYLERHQISNKEAMDVFPKRNLDNRTRKSRTNTDMTATRKFLDITAIRQQPKLLPKDI